MLLFLAFHSFVSAIPHWEEVCLVCGDVTNNSPIAENFFLQKSLLIAKFKAVPITTDLHTLAQQILAEFPLNASFGLTLVVFSTRSDEIENAFESAVSIVNSACVLKVFPLELSNINTLKEHILGFTQIHYQPTECVVEFGTFTCKLLLFPSYHSLSSRIRGDYLLPTRWRLEAVATPNEISSCMSKLKFKADFAAQTENYLQTFIVQSFFSRPESDSSSFILRDSFGNQAILSRSTCGKFIVFILVDFFSISYEQQSICDNACMTPASYLTYNATDSFPYWNKESIDDLFQKLINSAKKMDESKFLTSKV